MRGGFRGTANFEKPLAPPPIPSNPEVCASNPEGVNYLGNPELPPRTVTGARVRTP